MKKEQIEYTKVIARIPKKMKKKLYMKLLDKDLSFTKWLRIQIKKYLNGVTV